MGENMQPPLRFGLYYDFRNPPAWRRPYTHIYSEIFEQIIWAEQQGFDDVWLSEHHFQEDGYAPSLLPIAAAIAARTTTMRIGTAVLLLPLHHPVRVAEDAATVDVISNGRFQLGVGVGYKVEEFDSFAIAKTERGRRTNEGLEIRWCPSTPVMGKWATMDTICSSFRPCCLVSASACSTGHQRGDTDRFQLVILLTVTARQAGDLHPL